MGDGCSTASGDPMDGFSCDRRMSSACNTSTPTLATRVESLIPGSALHLQGTSATKERMTYELYSRFSSCSPS